MKLTKDHLSHPKYRPDIDGLRAIAVMAVVGYHAFPRWVPGGFIGVDIFFVISGYLISTIIFGNLEKGRFNYFEFYARRIKRIFPALLVVLLFSMVFGWYVLLSDEFRQLGKHVAGGAGFVSNIVLWSEAGYFDVASELKPLLHLWSLGIVEQFYILWPLLLGVVWRKKLNFLKVTFLVAVISFAINIYWVDRNPVADFFSPFSRIWELMVGGILAYIVLQRPHYLSSNPLVRSSLSVLGLALIFSSLAFFDRYTPFPAWWALLPTLGTFLVISGRPSAWVNRHFLSNRIAVWFGLISYPLYLWHWPIFSYARIIGNGTPDRSLRILAVVVSVVLAWATFTLIEKRYRKSYSKTSISVLSISMAILLLMGLLIWKGSISPRQNSASIERLFAVVDNLNFPGRLNPIEINSETFYTKTGSNKITLFIGDSYVQQYGPRITKILEDDSSLNSAVFATGGGCPPIPNVFEDKHHWCPDNWNAATSYMHQDEVETIVIGGAWNSYFLGHRRGVTYNNPKNYSYYYQKEGEEKHKFTDGDGIEFALKELELFLSQIAKSKQVFLLLDNPGGKAFTPKSFIEGSRLSQLRVTTQLKQNVSAEFSPEQQQLRAKLTQIANRSGVRIIDPASYLCIEQRCMVTTVNGEPVYGNGGHLRPFFVEEKAGYMDVTLK